MIRPQPESNLSLNLLVLGSEVIQILKTNRSFVIIEDVMSEFLKDEPQRTPDLFMSTLTYLFAVGLVEYQGYKLKLKGKDDYTQLHLF
jgi:hypothetical protein